MNEQQIIVALYRRFFSSIQIAAPRYTMRGWPWEMDLCTLTKSGYVTEFEVKVSRADFRKDAEKCATHWLGWDVAGRGSKTEKWVKHDLLAARDERGPNRFFYAMPKGLVTLDEVPPWAGLIELEETRYGQIYPRLITRPAPRLHSKKADEKLIQEIRRTLGYRFWHLTCADPKKLESIPSEHESEVKSNV